MNLGRIPAKTALLDPEREALIDIPNDRRMTFGTLDEDRWWDAEAYANGECIELSKEFVRSHYIDTGHQANLQKARDAGTDEPPIPALPQSVIDETAALYASMYERLTSQDF